MNPEPESTSAKSDRDDQTTVYASGSTSEADSPPVRSANTQEDVTQANGKCPACGSLIPPDSPNGLCPQCLIAGGMMSHRPTGGPGDFTPPGGEELDAALNGYEVLEMIGRGGMGAVYKARQTHLDRLVAIKILPIRDDEADPSSIFGERFKREARAMARFNHPNIVTIHDFGHTDNGYYYFVMEYVEGADLRELIHTQSIAPEQALAIIPQICEALQFAHGHGIIHRDIKPGNILLTKDGIVKVTDFGLAKILGVDTAVGGLTVAGHVMGTPNYASPEQLNPNSKVDHRTDIYSLGVVFYELLTGTLPKGVFEPPSQKVLIDVRLDEVVLRAMQERPEKRYQQASEVKSNVESIRDSNPARRWPKRSTRRQYQASHRLAKSILAFAVVALGVFASVRVVPWHSGDQDEVPVQTSEGSTTPRSTPSTTLYPSQPTQLPADDELKQIYDEALAMLKTDPAAAKKGASEALEGLKRANPRMAELKATVQMDDGELQVDLSGNHALLDLTPLIGLPITSLNLSHSLLKDIAPLKGMPLRILDLSETDVENLAPLEGMPLQELNLAYTQVKDVRPLRDLPLNDLDLSFANADQSLDLDGLEGVPLKRINLHGKEPIAPDHRASFLRHRFLEEINIAGTNLFDLSWLAVERLKTIVLTPEMLGDSVEKLRDAANVERIGVWDFLMPPSPHGIQYMTPTDFWERYESGTFENQIVELGARIDDALEKLEAKNSAQDDWSGVTFEVETGLRMQLQNLDHLEDISALNDLPITHLVLHHLPKLSDVSALGGMPLVQLEFLACPKVRNVQPLADLPLRYLALDGVGVRDFSPLKNLPFKIHLHLREVPLPDLGQLVGIPLKGLSLDSCPVDFSELDKLCVRVLQLMQLGVSSSTLAMLKGMPLERLDLRHNLIGDITPLRGMPIREIFLSHNPITDLTPLTGMPLEFVCIDHTQATDLTPLKDAPVAVLNAQETAIEDLSPLEGMPILELDISDTKVTDVTPLASMPLERLCYDPIKTSRGNETLLDSTTLREIALSGGDYMPARKFWTNYQSGAFVNEAIQSAVENLKAANPAQAEWHETIHVDEENASLDLANHSNLEDIAALQGLPLTSLRLDYAEVSDFSALQGMPLRRLSLYECSFFTTLAPITNLPLIELDLGSTQVSDLSALNGMPINRLTIGGDGTLIKNLSPLSTLPLEELHITNLDQISDWSLLATLTSLKTLRLWNTNIRDLEVLKQAPLVTLELNGSRSLADLKPLRGMAIRSLSVSETGVTDLSGLDGMPLTGLDLSATRVADLTALTNSKLNSINLMNSAVQDLTPLRNLPLETIALQVGRVGKSLNVLRQIATLEHIIVTHPHEQDPIPSEEFWERYDRGEFARERQIIDALAALKEANPEQTDWHETYHIVGEQMTLNLDGHAALRDLASIAKLPLTGIRLSQTGVSDLSPLKGMHLESLTIEYTSVDDLAALQGMPLRRFSCVHATEIRDYTPLRDLPLEDFTLLYSKALDDPSVLAGMPLKRLQVELGAGVRDLHVLSGMPLVELVIEGVGIADITSLQGMPLRSLELRHCPLLEKIEPLRGLLLRELNLGGTAVQNLDSLKGMPVKNLQLSGSKIDDLSALKGMPLEVLQIEQTAVYDFEPLRGMNLTTLACRDTYVRDLTPLEGMPLLEFHFMPSRIGIGMEMLREMKSIRVFNVSSRTGDGEQLDREAFWKRYDAGEFHQAAP